MGKIEIESDQSDNEFEVEEQKPPKKQQVALQKVKKSKIIQKEKTKNQSLQERMETEKKNENKFKGLQKTTNQQQVIRNPELYKKFIEKVETNPSLTHLVESFKGQDKSKNAAKTVQKKSVLSRGQRKRAENKKKILKKNLFNEYLNKTVESKGETDIDLDALKYDLEGIEKNAKNQKTQEKKQDLTRGVSNKKKLKTSNRDIQQVQQILQFKPFLNDPLKAMKEHIQNTLKMQKKM
ncbi:hypothetical protein ABPG72_006466 [Tetrahymena utriculariae]